jgi:hypothetical protein
MKDTNGVRGRQVLTAYVMRYTPVNAALALVALRVDDSTIRFRVGQRDAGSRRDQNARSQKQAQVITDEMLSTRHLRGMLAAICECSLSELTD